jgi:hypothetical protein
MNRSSKPGVPGGILRSSGILRPSGILRFLVSLVGLAVLAGMMFYLFFIFNLDRQGSYFSSAVVADLNGSGLLDVVLHNTRQESVTVAFGSSSLWINQGAMQFTTQDPVELPPYLYVDATAGDVDNDGDMDLFFLTNYNLVLVLNQGGLQGGETGEFKLNNPIQPFGEPAGMYGSVVLGDLDNDGQIDGFVAGCCGMLWFGQNNREYTEISRSWVWINDWNPRGWLDRRTISLPELDDLPIRAAALGDLNGDGFLDVFAAVRAPQFGQQHHLADRILLNDGAGGLTDSGQRLGDYDSTSVALADLDGDGDLDALVGAHSGWSVYINQGGAQGGEPGLFAALEQQPSEPVTGVFLADFGGNGRPDALITHQKEAYIWWNEGQGVFKRDTWQRFPSTNRRAFAVADFNNDGFPDIFWAEYKEAYSIWSNPSGGPP